MNYTTDQALQVAIEMERLGCIFYSALADACAQTDIATLSRDLARAEHTHEATFAQMRGKLAADQRKPQMREHELFLAARQLRNIILPTPEKVRQVVLRGDIRETLEMAIKMETDSIDFYSNAAASADADTAAMLSRIASEERTHLKALEERRKGPLAPGVRSH